MKIQLRGQFMRLRIDESELESLLSGAALVNVTALGANAAYRQTLRLAGGEQAQLDAANADWNLRLPDTRVRRYASSLPCREGLAFVLPAGESHVLNVTFEVDVRDSMRVRGTRQGVQECAADPAQLI